MGNSVRAVQIHYDNAAPLEKDLATLFNVLTARFKGYVAPPAATLNMLDILSTHGVVKETEVILPNAKLGIYFGCGDTVVGLAVEPTLGRHQYSPQFDPIKNTVIFDELTSVVLTLQIGPHI